MFRELMDMVRKLGADEVSLTASRLLLKVEIRKSVGDKEFVLEQAFSSLELASIFDQEFLVKKIINNWWDAKK